MKKIIVIATQYRDHRQTGAFELFESAQFIIDHPNPSVIADKCLEISERLVKECNVNKDSIRHLCIHVKPELIGECVQAGEPGPEAVG